MINIQVNQIGYRPSDVKVATFRIGDTKAVSDSVNTEKTISDTFRVVNSKSGQIVFEGNTSDIKESEINGEINATGDFSEVTTEGTYFIESDDNGRSYEFVIRDNVYEEVLKSSMKMFYLQRCGCELPKLYAEKYAHKACHNTMARIYDTEKYIDVTGGWHDAGDYGRYIVAAAKAVTDLMMAYEYFPDKIEKAIENYENRSGIPFIIDEIKYELDWMLKMQDPETGGVYHKVTCASFPGFVMAEEETEELIVSPISDAATCDFIATMAYAYRVYSGLEEKYGDIALEYTDSAEEYLNAAKMAVSFIENHTAGEFLNPKGIVTGEYGDSRTEDEFFWAYAEMYKTTGEKKYENALKEMDLDSIEGEFGWKEVGDYGFYAYITSDADKNSDFYKAVYKRFIDENNEKIAKCNEDAYRSSIYGNFYWGCLMEVADNAKRGIIIDKLQGTNDYRRMASAQLDYILGNNPNSKCFITGFGTNQVVNPHHRPSAAAGKAMPGMLVGGMEPLLLDDKAKELLQGFPPAKCYLDELDSYSTNEITIYWNSPIVFLLAYMCS